MDLCSSTRRERLNPLRRNILCGAPRLPVGVLLAMVALAGWIVPIYAQLPLLDIQVGSSFPTVPLTRADDGTLTTIEDFRGQKLVLHVFASW